MRSLIAATALLSAVAPTVGAQVGKLFPADEATHSADFFIFRAELLAGVARRDTAALLAVVAPDIRNSLGDDRGVAAYRAVSTEAGGAAAFRKTWALDSNPVQSPVWETLTTVLTLGGGFEDESTFVAPYTYRWFPPSADRASYVVTIGTDVPVRLEPRDGAPKLLTLSFDIVSKPVGTARPLTAAQAAAWQPVELRNRRIGYVDRRSVRSPLDYRAVFERREGKWVMIMLTTGD